MRTADKVDDIKQKACRQFIVENVLPFVFEIRDTTRESYAHVLEEIYKKHPWVSGSQQAHLTSIKVDVNDVWIVAVAHEHGLIVLTHDGMAVIKDCVTDVRFDDWLV